MVSPQNPCSQWMSISVPTIIAPKHTQSFTYTCLLVLISPKNYHDIYRNLYKQAQRHSHIMAWLGVAGVQADFRICPHILTLTEWLIKLTVNRTNQNLSWEQLGRNTQVSLVISLISIICSRAFINLSNNPHLMNFCIYWDRWLFY